MNKWVLYIGAFLIREYTRRWIVFKSRLKTLYLFVYSRSVNYGQSMSVIFLVWTSSLAVAISQMLHDGVKSGAPFCVAGLGCVLCKLFLRKSNDYGDNFVPLVMR